MWRSLSRLADNLAEGILKNICKVYQSDLEHVAVKRNTITLKCVDCNKIYEKDFDKDLAGGFKTPAKSTVLETLTTFF